MDLIQEIQEWALQKIPLFYTRIKCSALSCRVCLQGVESPLAFGLACLLFFYSTHSVFKWPVHVRAFSSKCNIKIEKFRKQTWNMQKNNIIKLSHVFVTKSNNLSKICGQTWSIRVTNGSIQLCITSILWSRSRSWTRKSATSLNK